MQDTMRVFFGVAPFLPLQPSDNPYSDKMRKARCKDNDFSCRADVLDDIIVKKNPRTYREIDAHLFGDNLDTEDNYDMR